MASNNDYCSVPQCNSWAKRDTEKKLTFHRFPEENDPRVYFETEMGRELISRRKAWISKVRIGKPFSKFKKVCSLHFKQDDYINKGENTRRGRVLKKTAVPSQNLPASVVTLNTKSDSKRAERLSKRTSEECSQVGTSKERSQSDNDIQEAKKSVCEEETSSIKMVMCFVPDCKHYSNQKTCNYFTFPADVKERKKWINLIRRKDREPTKYSLVCSCHFKDQNRKNRPTIFEFNKEKRLDFEYTGKRKRKPSQKYIADYGEVALVAGSSKRSKRNRVQKGKSQLAFSGQRAQNEIANCFDLTNTNESANKPPLDQNEKVLRNILQPNKKTQSAPRPDSDCEFDPLDLNNLLLSTTSIFQGMCKELEMTSKMNENIDYLNLDKERITLTAAGGQNEKSLQVFMVNKHPLHPDETSLSDTTDKLDQMITDVENTVMVDNDDLSRISESSSIGTQTDNRTLEMENKQLKSEIASLKMRISSLQKQMMRQDVPRLLFVTSESNLR